MNECTHCSTYIEQVGTLWYHKPTPSIYKIACPTWGYKATPKPVSDAS